MSNLAVSRETSKRMAAVARRDTGAERAVRRALHLSGHRFRTHADELPGTPDIVNRSRKWAVFVHGCFWHRHGCSRSSTPKTRRQFWLAKFRANAERDRRALIRLRRLGFLTIVVWECEALQDSRASCRRLRDRLRVLHRFQKRSKLLGH